MTPGELLQAARRRHGLTQRQLAARARTSQAAISRAERDLVSPSVATLAGWLDLMGEELQLDAEPIDYGHDLTLNQTQLRLTPEERIARQAGWSSGLGDLDRTAESFDPLALLEALSAADVDFVVIGRVAGQAHGSAYATADLDVVYARDRENLTRLASALKELGAAIGAEAFANGTNHEVVTRHGRLELVAEREGARRYEELRSRATTITIRGRSVLIASLDDLIAKNDAGRLPRDKLTASEYRALSDFIRGPQPAPRIGRARSRAASGRSCGS